MGETAVNVIRKQNRLECSVNDFHSRGPAMFLFFFKTRENLDSRQTRNISANNCKLASFRGGPDPQRSAIKSVES